ncbi:MAG: 3-phosphoshikimate 1-carboxyvinyltransferase [Syntrophales bacterium LBB04]|nr:3-phosphoshikimate 1-carboxyvinyltransferase [Syntrophales bacterium LBB04]
MKEIKPLERLDAKVILPGSKSYSQRALIIAALAEGNSCLKNLLAAEDTGYMTEALRLMGAHISNKDDDVLVRGTGGTIKNPGKPIFLGNNGTAMRFLISLAALGQGEFVLTGESRLCERPVKPLLDALATLNVDIHTDAGRGLPPVTVNAHGMGGGTVIFHNVASSQYVSSLLISTPYAREDVRIKLTGRTVSLPYIEMTIEAMRRYGVEVKGEGTGEYIIRGGQSYRGISYLVEGDASTASYFFLAAALCRGRIKVLNINPRSLQGDIRILSVMEDLGCKVTRGADWVEIIGAALRPGDYTVDMGDMPDMVPTLAVMSAFRDGRTEITNVAHLRIKESNRIAALVSEIGRMGIAVEEREEGLVITGGIPHGAEIETYNDHRIAMSFAIAGLVVPGMKIANPQCVKKSFPEFWGELEKLMG